MVPRPQKSSIQCWVINSSFSGALDQLHDPVEIRSYGLEDMKLVQRQLELVLSQLALKQVLHHQDLVMNLPENLLRGHLGTALEFNIDLLLLVQVLVIGVACSSCSHVFLPLALMCPFPAQPLQCGFLCLSLAICLCLTQHSEFYCLSIRLSIARFALVILY